MMNDLVGIDPQAPSSLRDLSDLLKLFSPSQGRFIADFPGEWAGELRKHLRSFSDLGKMKADEAIKHRLTHAILPIKGRFRPEMTWPENAMLLRNKGEVDISKFIGPAGKPGNVVEPIDQVLSDLDSFPDASGALIDRSADAYVNAARPILMLSRKVVLVDPYVSLKYRSWRKVLLQFMQEAVKWRQVEAFEIYYSPEKSGQNLDSQRANFESVSKEAEAIGIAIRVHSLDHNELGKQHARYLLGKENGLHFDHGFDIGNYESKNHVTWVGQPVLKALLDRFT